MDEYDDYIPTILPLLKGGTDVQQISLKLQQIAKNMMNMDAVAEVNMTAVEKIEKEDVVDERSNSSRHLEDDHGYSPRRLRQEDLSLSQPFFE